MHPIFGIEREKDDSVYFMEYTNDSGKFQFHSQIELYFVDEGEMEVFINDRRRILRGGEMSVALSYDAHGYSTPVFSKSSLLIIPPYVCDEFVSSVRNKKISDPFIRDRETVKKAKHYFDLLKSAKNEIELKGYIYVILGIVRESLNFEESHEETDPELSSKLLFLINRNYKNDISLKFLAAELGYNENYLSSYFKSCFRTGIKQYINILRLKKALELIHEQKHNITYCAFESGFGSVRTFYRAFYKEFGCSPKEYLKKGQQAF